MNLVSDGRSDVGPREIGICWCGGIHDVTQAYDESALWQPVEESSTIFRTVIIHRGGRLGQSSIPVFQHAVRLARADL